MAKIIQVFFDADMRNGHDGLVALARKSDLNIQTLESGTFAVFINGKQNMIKLYAPNNVIAFYRAPAHSKVELRTIPLIVKSFHATRGLDYDAALKTVIEQRLGAKSSAETQV